MSEILVRIKEDEVGFDLEYSKEEDKIKLVGNNVSYLLRQLSELLEKSINLKSSPETNFLVKKFKFTNRQIEVMLMLMSGLKWEEMSKKIGKGFGSIDTALLGVRNKLGIENPNRLVFEIIFNNILTKKDLYFLIKKTHTLTQKETDFVKWLVYGKSNAEIECIMGFSKLITDNLMVSIKSKLETYTRHGIISIALVNNLVDVYFPNTRGSIMTIEQMVNYLRYYGYDAEIYNAQTLILHNLENAINKKTGKSELIDKPTYLKADYCTVVAFCDKRRSDLVDF